MSEKIKKKRKLHDSSQEKSNKRRSLDESDKQITLSVKDPESLPPFFASAPGFKIDSIAFDAYAKAGESPATRELLLQSSDHPQLDYAGVPEIDIPVKHFLGILNTTKNALQLIPAQACTVRSTLQSETREVQVRNKARNKWEQRQELGKEFGTKKAKRAIASKTVNAVTGSTVKGVEAATLQGIDAGSALPTKEQREADLLKEKPIPPPNLDAENAEDVYTLEVLVPSANMRAQTVMDWQEVVKAGKPVENLRSRYVAHRVQRVVDRGDVQRLKALKYLSLLIDFANALPSMKGGRKVPQRDALIKALPDWTEANVKSVLRRFAKDGSMSKYQLDYFMTHIAAISLFIDGWRTDTTDLREDLRLEPKQMSQYFHELGSRIRAPYESEWSEFKIQSKAQAAQRKVAALKLPLEFPKTRLPPRRR